MIGRRGSMRWPYSGGTRQTPGWVVVLVVLLSGCPSVHSAKDYYDSVRGRPIDSQIDLFESPGSYQTRNGIQPRTYSLDNGHTVYVGADSRECYVHLEADERGIIVGYRLEGRRCAW